MSTKMADCSMRSLSSSGMPNKSATANKKHCAVCCPSQIQLLVINDYVLGNIPENWECFQRMFLKNISRKLMENVLENYFGECLLKSSSEWFFANFLGKMFTNVLKNVSCNAPRNTSQNFPENASWECSGKLFHENVLKNISWEFSGKYLTRTFWEIFPENFTENISW